jgi:hypothetical protein
MAIISKGKDGEGLNIREEEGKSCCSLRWHGLPILCEPHAVGGVHIKQTDTATSLCHATCREALLLGGQRWVWIWHYQLLSLRANISLFPCHCRRKNRKTMRVTL